MWVERWGEGRGRVLLRGGRGLVGVGMSDIVHGLWLSIGGFGLAGGHGGANSCAIAGNILCHLQRLCFAQQPSGRASGQSGVC